jgi:superfamily II DNA or RNA helicase
LWQWREVILKSSYFKPGHVGFIGAGEFDIKPITLASIETLVRLDSFRREQLARTFLLAIFDEVHHLAAPVFCKAATIFRGTRIGLSRTIARDDGLSFLYFWTMGRNVFIGFSDRPKPEVIFSYVDLSDLKLQKMSFSDIISSLCESRPFLDRIVYDVSSGLQFGYKQVVLSSRLNFLDILERRLSETFGSLVGRIDGNTILGDRLDIMKSRRIILASMSLLKEGVDDPELNAIYIVTPLKDRNSLIQIAGRLERGSFEKTRFLKYYVPMSPMLLRVADRAWAGLVRHGYVIRTEK